MEYTSLCTAKLRKIQPVLSNTTYVVVIQRYRLQINTGTENIKTLLLLYTQENNVALPAYGLSYYMYYAIFE
jgi:hypothetical protein